MNIEEAINELKEEINKPLEVPEDKVNTFILYNIESAKTILNLIEKQSKEIEHQIEKRANQRNELAILNAKQVEFNKLVNTVNSYKGQFKRQQKEIEELKEKHKKITDEYLIQRDLINSDFLKDYIHKDKIKEILGIEEDIDNEKLVSLLQTIVDENERLEEIEDRKVQIEYNNVFNKGVKSVEDKIKAKIEELEKERKRKDEEDIINLFYDQIDITHIIETLEELLEKE